MIFLRGLAVVLAALVALPLFAGDRQGARHAFQEALYYYQRLQERPENARTIPQYRRAIFLFTRVVDEDPTYGACDDALFHKAGLYEEMARRFGEEEYRKKAAHYFRFLAEQYPTSKHRRPALERAAALTETGPRRETAAPAAPPTLPPQTQKHAVDEALALVSDIRFWSTQDYTRVVIQLNREVTFRKEILSEPHRLYIDFDSSKLRPELSTTYNVNDLFIKQIRVAENRPGIVRVVLDFDRIHQHSVFALYDPYRIVLDFRGTPKSAKPPESTAGPAAASKSAPPATGPAVRPPTASPPAALPPALPQPAAGAKGDLSMTRVLGLKVGKVVIDPGHGGRDTGTIGPKGLKEKDLVLDVALRLRRLLEGRLGTEVVLTRETDRFVPLEERTAIANQQGADLFVSIHANASRSKTVSGAETFYLSFASNPDERAVASRENATSQRNISELEDLLRKIALGDYNKESQELARTVQDNLHREMSRHRPRYNNRGVKKAPFIVLIGANMPSILTEIGFLSNPADESFLKRNEGRDYVAEALYGGIESYFQGLGIPPLYERTAQSLAP
jgi:N-acetylmuramoyl-L-alanine amidase